MTRFMIAALGSALVGAGAYATFDDPAPVTRAALAPTAVEIAPAYPQSRAAKPSAMSSGYEKPDYLSQSYGTVCETPRGECTVSPKPINSLCTCGSSPGKIIR